jgi:hypothetical protein
VPPAGPRVQDEQAIPPAASSKPFWVGVRSTKYGTIQTHEYSTGQQYYLRFRPNQIASETRALVQDEVPTTCGCRSEETYPCSGKKISRRPGSRASSTSSPHQLLHLHIGFAWTFRSTAERENGNGQFQGWCLGIPDVLQLLSLHHVRCCFAEISTRVRRRCEESMSPGFLTIESI